MDLLGLASVTSVQLFPRSDGSLNSLPVLIYVGNTSLVPGGSSARLSGASWSACYSNSSNATVTSSLTAACVGVGRYVTVQLNGTQAVGGTHTLTLCSLLVYGTLLYTPPSVVGVPSLSYGMPVLSSTINGGSLANVLLPVQVRARTARAARPNRPRRAPAQRRRRPLSTRRGAQYASSAALNSSSWSTLCGSSRTFLSAASGTDAAPFFQVDLLTAASVTAVQLWGRSDAPGYNLAPVAVWVTNTSLTPGSNSVTLSGTPCITVYGAVAKAMTLPCVGTGRFVWVQMLSTSYAQFGAYMSLCAVQARDCPPPRAAGELRRSRERRRAPPLPPRRCSARQPAPASRRRSRASRPARRRCPALSTGAPSPTW